MESSVERRYDVRLPAILRIVSNLIMIFTPSLTGLLSFMLSEEMTTGSVTSSDSHKRSFAQRSHQWNLEQTKFREAFPEVSWIASSLLMFEPLDCSLDPVSKLHAFHQASFGLTDLGFL